MSRRCHVTFFRCSLSHWDSRGRNGDGRGRLVQRLLGGKLGLRAAGIGARTVLIRVDALHVPCHAGWMRIHLARSRSPSPAHPLPPPFHSRRCINCIVHRAILHHWAGSRRAGARFVLLLISSLLLHPIPILVAHEQRSACSSSASRWKAFKLSSARQAGFRRPSSVSPLSASLPHQREGTTDETPLLESRSASSRRHTETKRRHLRLPKSRETSE